MDARHAIFVPEYHSREANPGEPYPDPSGSGTLVDRGEQGVRWDRELVALDCENVAYVFHVYDPWSFTGAGGSTFSTADIIEAIERRVAWRDSVGHAPLIVTEYGVNWQQPVARRLEWLRLVHDALAKNDVGATFFNYKVAVNPWVDRAAIWAIYGQYRGRNDFGAGEASAYKLRADAQAAAERTEFDVLFQEWYSRLSSDDASRMDHRPIVDERTRFASLAP